MADETELVERVRSGSLTFRNGNPVPSGDTCVVKSEDLRALCDTIEALQRERDALREALREARAFVIIQGPGEAFPDVIAKIDAALSGD